MSGHAGGATSKLGLLYEAHWTVHAAFIPILLGRAQHVLLEPVGRQGDGIEFRLTLANGTGEVHQCKDRTGFKPASLAPIVKALLPHLHASSSAIAVLVSGQATPLARAAGQARLEPDEVAGALTLNATEAAAYDEFREAIWPGDRQAAWAYLRRLRFEGVGTETLSRQVLAALGAKEDEAAAWATLCSLVYLVFARPGLSLDAAMIRAHLRNTGARFGSSVNVPLLKLAIERLHEAEVVYRETPDFESEQKREALHLFGAALNEASAGLKGNSRAAITRTVEHLDALEAVMSERQASMLKYLETRGDERRRHKRDMILREDNDMDKEIEAGWREHSQRNTAQLAVLACRSSLQKL